MAETNPYIGKSQAELKRQMELLTQAMEAEEAALDVAATVALKWAMRRLKERGKLGSNWDAITPQSLPKESLMAKPAGYSESEVSAIDKRVLAAIEKAAKG